MLNTTVDLTVIPARTFNGTKNALVATLLDGREIWLGESDSRGVKRAKIDVLSVDPNTGNGAALAKKLRWLESENERWNEQREAEFANTGE